MKPSGVVDFVDETGNIGGDVLESFVVHQIHRLYLQCINRGDKVYH